MMRRWQAIGLGVVGTAVLAAGGCKTVTKDQYEAAVRENTELRERLAGLQESVSSANNQTDSFSGEITSLSDENERLRSESSGSQQAIAAAEARAAAAEAQAQMLQDSLNAGGYQTASASGFEGIPGVRGVNGRSGGDIAVEMAGDVLFSSGSTRLTKKAKGSLDQIASVIKGKYGSNAIRVEGYTDSDPIRKSKWKTNRRLSSERAMAVEDYLVSKGIKDSRIYSAAYGSADARSSKSQSRRVEIVIMGS